MTLSHLGLLFPPVSFTESFRAAPTPHGERRKGGCGGSPDQRLLHAEKPTGDDTGPSGRGGEGKGRWTQDWEEGKRRDVIPLWPRNFGTPGPKTCWRSSGGGAGADRQKNGGLLASEAGGDRGGHKRGGSGFAGPAGTGSFSGPWASTGERLSVADCRLHRAQGPSVVEGPVLGGVRTAGRLEMNWSRICG